MSRALICIVLLFQITCLADIEDDCQQGDEYPTVFELYKAAEHGDPNAQFKLGNMCMNGEEIEQNDVEAVKWLTKAALQGHDTAQNNLGYMYHDGRGVEANDLEAIKWLQKSAEQGSEGSRFTLAGMCASYNSMSQNYFKVRKLLFQSANQGDVFFQSSLAEKYLHGTGMPQNYSKALKWYRKATQQNNKVGLQELVDNRLKTRFKGLFQNKIDSAVRCYNYVEAYKWFLIAEKSNIKIDKTNEIKDEILKKMSPEYIQQAITLAEQFTINGDVNDLEESPTPTFGTAFLISSQGHMLTSFDVIKNAVRVQVIFDGKNYPARIIKTNQDSDMALLKTAITKDEYLKILKYDNLSGFLRDSSYYNSNAKVGDKVFAFGFSGICDKSEDSTLCEGVISNLRIPTCLKEHSNFYELKMPFQPGNIGGPLIDEDGNVIGLIASRPDLSSLTPILNGLVDPNKTYGVKASMMSPFIAYEIESEMKEAGAQDIADEKTLSIEDVKKAVGLVICY